MAIHTAYTSGSGAVPVFTGKKDTDIWIPVLLVDKTDGITGETGIAHGSVDVDYGLASSTSLTSYTVASDCWKEMGEGLYALKIGASEFTSTGRYFVRIGDTTPEAGKYVVAVEVTVNDLDDLADDLLSVSSIPVFTAKEDVDSWIPVYLTDKSDGSTAITGLASSNVDVDFGLASATSLTSYSPAAADWKEMGEGMYALRIGAAEFTSTGRYFVRVTGTGTNSGKYMFAVETNTSSIDDIASASINEIPNFSCKKATDTFIPVLLVSAADGVTPVTGVAHSSVDADFAVGGATSLTSYSLASADWKEMGEGMYSIRIGAGEFSATGRYFLRVVDTSGNASKYFASIDVNESTIDDVVNNPNNIAVFSAKASTDTFVPVRLTSAADGKTGITGIAHGSIDVDYGLASATSYTSYTVTSDDWKEMGEGMYALRIGAGEFTSTGRYFVRVTGTGTTSGKYMFAVETNTSSIDDIASASINEIPNFSVKKATDTFIPVLLVSAADGSTPVTGVAHGSVDADFAVGGATSLTSYSPAAADWKEMGEGMYSIRIGAGEFSATGRYFLRVVDTSGNASKFFASIDVNESDIDDVVTNPNNVAVFSAKTSTDTWVPVRLTSATDGKSGITGVAYGSIDVDYGLASATSYTGYTVTTDDWKEMGEGMYALRIGAGEFGSVGRYIIRVVDSGATALKYMASVETTAVDVDSLVRATTPGDTLDVDANGLVDVSKFNGTAAVVENSLLSVNIASISEDNAADTLESIIEGGTQLAVDATKISGDATAADNLELFTEQLNGGKIASTTFRDASITADVIAADAIGASELAADAVAEIADAVWDEATSGHTTSGTFGEQLKTDVDAILADTGTDGVKINLAQAMGETHSDLTVGKALYLTYAHFAHKWTTSGGLSKVFKADNTTVFQTRTITSSTEIGKGS